MSNKQSQITICIGNYGAYNTGYLIDRWIDLPMEPAKLDNVFKQMQDTAEKLAGTPCEEFYISDFDGYPFNCKPILNEYTSIEDMNLLAYAMEAYPYRCEAIQDILNSGFDEPKSVIGLINWIISRQEIPFYYYDIPKEYQTYVSNLSTYEKLGLDAGWNTRWRIELEEHGVIDYFDWERYGESISQEVFVCDNGYVDARQDMPDEDFYSLEDIKDMLL